MLPLNKKQPATWQDAMKFVGRCPICNAEYPVESAKLFARKDSANMVHINCSKCGSAVMFMIMVIGHGLSSVGMVTDLSFEDAKRLYGADEITLDEALAAYSDIRNNKIF